MVMVSLYHAYKQHITTKEMPIQAYDVFHCTEISTPHSFSMTKLDLCVYPRSEETCFPILVE